MAYLNDPPSIDLMAITWDETGMEADPAARLLAHIQIGPVNMHLEAWAVTDNEEGEQVGLPESWRDQELDQLQGWMETAFDTVEINGREYVLIATPYGR